VASLLRLADGDAPIIAINNFLMQIIITNSLLRIHYYEFIITNSLLRIHNKKKSA